MKNLTKQEDDLDYVLNRIVMVIVIIGILVCAFVLATRGKVILP